jgi:ribosome-associated toxin RatA of RatAB toxin-antitoxin module
MYHDPQDERTLMPRVENSIIINGLIDHVYESAKDIETFPQYMPDVKDVKILEHKGNGVVISEWSAYIPDFMMTVKWTEEDTWNDEARTCDFKLVKGDYAAYSGKWTFTEEDGGVKFYSLVEYEYDIPLIGALIKGLVQRKVQENVDQILLGVKKKVEGVE